MFILENFDCVLLLFQGATGGKRSAGGLSGGIKESDHEPLEIQEAISLKERMALYEAAASKVEISNSSANVRNTLFCLTDSHHPFRQLL